MNYFDYIYGIKPDNSLKNSTKSKVMLEISKQKSKKNNIKKICISIAACFIILAASVFTAETLTGNSEYIENLSENSKEAKTDSEKISINTDPDNSTAIPQEILIGEHLYLQYLKADTVKSTENNEIEINRSDIGEFIYRIDESNLVDGMQSLKASDTDTTGKSKFYHAEVYKLNNYKNNTAVLVKEENKEEYYLFYLINE